jgi:hypothetical protein
MAHSEIRIRFLSSLLTAGGVICGLLCSVFMFRTWDSLVFLPGYIITVGYAIRCFHAPRLYWRRVIWGSSTIVQGAWAVGVASFAIYGVLRYGGMTFADFFGFMIYYSWWIFALVVSIYGFRYDNKPAA